ncbi:hypothetical protein NHF50_12255 [Flavobacterium sp. NRK F10]|uniref:Uncharacterized protein n=1 Tax=Flavobacterium sediminis TaxID=2201181 RepID=A0A2U8QWI7_9FLAO|nr:MULTISPECIES: hypothetical protein [Flavobacterium]AWM14572.1 hypothetical protein DI487_12385 [Flavobacterium sediminis]MCO6175816.1 hypothetical protein [Flavobacterium sp. NRK F10]
MKLLGIGSRIKHAEYGTGVVTNVSARHYWVTFIEKGIETIDLTEEFEVIEAVEAEVDTVSFYEVEKMLKNLLQKYTDISPATSLADKWKGGRILLESGNDTQNKEIPIDTFFHKIVMVRDRIRVMEQKINSSNLDELEKVELQQYITRIYGSLTTFNVLFKLKEDYFIGEKSK